MKLLYSACWYDDCFPFNALLKDPEAVEIAQFPEDLKETDSMLVVWGGADIHPDYYNHPMHRTTYPGGRRDALEWTLVQRAIELNIPIIGVCRGAQMLCAAAGGFLIQNVHNHQGSHFVRTHDNDYFNVNSIHHQMMAGLEKVDHELVAWREGSYGKPYGYMDDKVYDPPEGFKEAEFVYFPKIRGYAIQWHPEGMPQHCDATKYILNYITKKEEHERNQYATATCDC